ncbi:hypothetical protein SALBM217S_07845 [Streptomyces griseoloalbus]
MAASARAGPERWVTQWTVPRTQTALPRAVWSGDAEPNQRAAFTGNGWRWTHYHRAGHSRAARLGAVEVVESAAPPALDQTTREPSVDACRA